ncbi:MAG: alpha/beta fold hydrolase, partial [Thermoanaerobaculia bacterium]|nr:alpha/beta fold hydrolase [Thermoanaerobaculia bacterium]
MVNAQQILMERKLGIRHVHAIAGFSMGGMECFQWAVSYPDYMSKLIPIAGAARPTPYDRLFYTTMLTSIETGMNDSLGAVKARQLIGLLFAMHVYAESYIQQLSADSLYLEYANGWAGGFANADLHDFARQTYALLYNNTFHGLSQPEKTVIENVRAKMFIIVNRNDRDVHPQSAISFAQNNKAQLLELDSDFGHLSFFREFASIAPRVRAFLEQP